MRLATVMAGGDTMKVKSKTGLDILLPVGSLLV